MPRPESNRWNATQTWLLIACLLVAALGARPYAGGWNDGSRLAAIEAIVDRHSLHIEGSVFVDVPRSLVEAGHAPYADWDTGNNSFGTRDKLLIGGHYYSDKPVLISLLMAVPYQLWQWVGGPSFAQRPDLVCWFLTFCASGFAFAIAAIALYRIGGLFGFDERLRLGLTLTFAFGSIALAYTRHVNNHIVLAGVFAALLLNLVRLNENRGRIWRLIVIGLLAGIGFNLDLGLAPALIACLFGYLAFRAPSPPGWGEGGSDPARDRLVLHGALPPSPPAPLPRSTGGEGSKRRLSPWTRNLMDLAIVALAATPWIGGQLAINHAIGGTLKPMNMVPEYSQWPGCPFNPANMTGVAQQAAGDKIVYILSLGFGKHGFLQYTVPLLLVVPAVVLLLRRRFTIPAELTFALIWSLLGGLMYGMLSNNHGGACCSIRWFVPFLVPCLLLLGCLQQQLPEYRGDFRLLAGWGVLLAIALWWVGPFPLRMNAAYWPIQGAALLSWGIHRWHGVGELRWKWLAARAK